MAQQPTSNSQKTAITVIQWISVFIFVITFVVGILSIISKSDVLLAVISFVVSIAAVPLSILQINKGAFSFILRNKKIGVQVFGVFLLAASLSWNIYHYISLPHQPSGQPPTTPTVIAPSTTSNTSTTPIATPTDQSSLIPAGIQPTVSDPLVNNDQGYEWDQGANSQQTGICDFVAGSYQISAPAGSSGIGCNMENTKGIFSNFVYQIRMTILAGVDGSNAAACTTFRVNATQVQDQVCFTQDGYWSIDGSAGTLSNDTSQFPYFVTGINQVNYITIRASGSSFQVQVNGHNLGGTYTDPGISSGFLGVSLAPDTSASKVAFSDLRVWTL